MARASRRAARRGCSPPFPVVPGDGRSTCRHPPCSVVRRDSSTGCPDRLAKSSMASRARPGPWPVCGIGARHVRQHAELMAAPAPATARGGRGGRQAGPAASALRRTGSGTWAALPRACRRWRHPHSPRRAETGPSSVPEHTARPDESTRTRPARHVAVRTRPPPVHAPLRATPRHPSPPQGDCACQITSPAFSKCRPRARRCRVQRRWARPRAPSATPRGSRRPPAEFERLRDIAATSRTNPGESRRLSRIFAAMSNAPAAPCTVLPARKPAPRWDICASAGRADGHQGQVNTPRRSPSSTSRSPGFTPSRPISRNTSSSSARTSLPHHRPGFHLNARRKRISRCTPTCRRTRVSRTPRIWRSALQAAPGFLAADVGITAQLLMPRPAAP